MDEMNTYRCYSVLDVERSAPPQKVKQAYFDLAYMWHPDRVPPEMKDLKEKAESKLKEINAAYDYYLRHVHGIKSNVTPPRSAHEAKDRRAAAAAQQWDQWIGRERLERQRRMRVRAQRWRTIGIIGALALIFGIRILETHYGNGVGVQFVVAAATMVGMFILAAVVLTGFADAFASKIDGS